MKEQDLIGRRVERVLTRVLPNTIILRKQEGEVRREVQRSNGKKVWVRFDGNSIDTSVEVLKLKIID
ncbi:hypothetical protein K0G91_02375 [Bacteroides ovatus]|jgi:hypothetical protein|uniref:hypothetical protein n=1 Tax=Bacteroides ovatus TaxID=28116 RepID=UPI001F46F70A|nr:hypothetical protein [Bacteroides ovatus]MCE9211795.1 hypothetical protein [Bacteroides ovatus]